MRIVVIGGGELAQQLVHYIQTYDIQANVIGFVDDFALIGEERFGLKCLGLVSSVPDLYTSNQLDAVIIGIGYNHRGARQYLFDTLHSHVPFYTLIHPSAFVDPTAIVGEGCFVGPHSIIEQRAIIGSNVFLYGGVNISHDSEIGAHTFVAPSVAVAGFAKIGFRCFLGIHATVIERVHIANDVVIGAAALVVHNLSEAGLYIGSPAKIKSNAYLQ